MSVTLLAMPIWLPVMLITSFAILITSGWPIVYLSKRYVLKNTYKTVMKFRAMVKDADIIANRDTIPSAPGKMLNIVIDDTLYTPIGKFLEKAHFTELPQLLQVLSGTFTLVGNRPMPENMLVAARALYPCLEERFLIPAGITGPAQIVGRDHLTDEERLKLEITYSYICQQSYSPLLDLQLMFMTVVAPLGFYNNLSADEVLTLITRHVKSNQREEILRKVDAQLHL